MFSDKILRSLMAKAYEVSLQSPDPSTQIGATLVRRNQDGSVGSVVTGYNHFYEGIPNEVNDRNKKLQGIEHGERDAIYNSAKMGICTSGAIMFAVGAACYDCTRSIIGSGIGCLVYHYDRYLVTDERWIESVNEGLTWMEDAGIFVMHLTGSIPSKPILVSGKYWSPETCEYV